MGESEDGVITLAFSSASRPFFGMTAGNGEFWTWKQKVGHIGMSVGRDDIRY